jgi:hypothetical protein
MFVWAVVESPGAVAPVLVVAVADTEDNPLCHRATQDMALEEVLLVDRVVTQDQLVGRVAVEAGVEPLY